MPGRSPPALVGGGTGEQAGDPPPGPARLWRPQVRPGPGGHLAGLSHAWASQCGWPGATSALPFQGSHAPGARVWLCRTAPRGRPRGDPKAPARRWHPQRGFEPGPSHLPRPDHAAVSAKGQHKSFHRPGPFTLTACERRAGAGSALRGCRAALSMLFQTVFLLALSHLNLIWTPRGTNQPV